MRDEHKGILAVAISGLLFGTSGILTRLITGVPDAEIAFFRSLVGFLAIALFLFLRRERITIPMAKDYKYFALLGLSVGVGYFFVSSAMNKTLVANATVLLNTSPLFIVLLAPIMLREKIKKQQLIGILVTFIGASIIVGIDKFSLNQQFMEGDIFALGDGVMYALYTIAIRKLEKNYSLAEVTFWAFGLGTLVAIFCMVLAGGFITTISQSSIVYLVLLGLVPSGIAVTLYNISLKYLKAQITSTIVLLEVVAATFYAAMILKEFPSPLSIFGIFLVLIGLVLTVYLD
jgi:drug/metabolite transporter (DMT)-like permease